MRTAIDNLGWEWAVSADSDAEFDPLALLEQMRCVCRQVAIGIVPMVIGGGSGVLNINDGQGRISLSAYNKLIESIAGSSDGLVPVQSGGFGLVVFSLPWFRLHWPEPCPERISMERSEDIALCESVVRRGGRCVALQVDAVHHELVDREGVGIYYRACQAQIR